MTQDDSRMSQNEGERRGLRGLFLGRYYSSKWLTFPVNGNKKRSYSNIYSDTSRLGHIHHED